MIDDIYRLMCETSPIQKEFQDNNFRSYKLYKLLFGSVIWRPTQEEWQEIFHKHYPTLKGLIDIQEVVHFIPIHGRKIIGEKTKDSKWSELWTLLWCLFVHHSIYRLLWDFKENKWMKV
jgi:hypothetical protein